MPPADPLPGAHGRRLAGARRAGSAEATSSDRTAIRSLEASRSSPRVTWVAGTRLLLAASACAALGAPAAVTARQQARNGAAARASAAAAQSLVRVDGALWVDCNRSGSRSSSDPPIVGATVELAAPNGEIWTAVTGARGRYAFTVHRSGALRIEVPLIQSALSGYEPSRSAAGAPRPGRSAGTRVADLDQAAVADPRPGRGAVTDDFGFVPSGAAARAYAAKRCAAR